MSYLADVEQLLEGWEPERRAAALSRAAELRTAGFKPSEATLRAWIERRPASTPVVVNRHHFTKPWPWQCFYVGRPYPLCNPFPHDCTKQLFYEATANRGWPRRSQDLWAGEIFGVTPKERPPLILKAFRADLELQLRRGGETRDMLVGTLPESALVCSCATSPHEEKSKPCHAFILVRAWHWLRVQERQSYGRPPAQLGQGEDQSEIPS